MKYFFTCQCGVQTPIDIGQAGQTITCQCGQASEAPTMREIRQLPLAPEHGRPAQANWSHKQGVLFSSGIVFAVIALTFVGLFSLMRSSIRTEKPQPDPRHYQAFVEQVDSKTPVELLEQWSKAADAGLGIWNTPPYIQARKASQVFLYLIIASLSCVGLGVVITLSSFFLRPSPGAG